MSVTNLLPCAFPRQDEPIHAEGKSKNKPNAAQPSRQLSIQAEQLHCPDRDSLSSKQLSGLQSLAARSSALSCLREQTDPDEGLMISTLLWKHTPVKSSLPAWEQRIQDIAGGRHY
jgi:hypothetical protein